MINQPIRVLLHPLVWCRHMPIITARMWTRIGLELDTRECQILKVASQTQQRCFPFMVDPWRVTSD